MNENAVKQDPFIFDMEQMQAVAAEHTIRLGLAHFQQNSVTELDCEGDYLLACVEDMKSTETLSTGLQYDADGNLIVSCDCNDESVFCHHAVALLYAYADEKEGGKELQGAFDNAIDERIKSGRSEVDVKKQGGKQGFGLWKARSLSASSRFSGSYQVHIRSLIQRSNYCSCPDFAGNQLGTCKHIEAVMQKISKLKNFARLKRQGNPYPYIFLNWDVEQAPKIALHRPSVINDELEDVLQEYFDERGLFSGRLPDDFFRLAEQLENREDIDLGQDAMGFARKIAADEIHITRAQTISKKIISSGGRLPGIKAKLYPYQVEGVAFLAANGRALLADDMGLGKTLQAIAAASWLHKHDHVERVLIVCPASLKHQWSREISKFTGLETQIIQGNAQSRGVQYRRACVFTIINYELVLRDLSVINELFSPDLLILDEAQRIKNWRTQIATVIKLIPSRFAFVLTGTPLENRLEDLYSLMQVVDSRVLGPLWRYLINFHITDEKGKVLGYRNLSELRKRLAPVMLRRDRRLVADQLPERIQQQIDLPMTDMQQELHDTAMQAAATLAQINKKRPLTPGEQNRMMAALQQARMACDAAGLVDKETQGAPKLDELDKLLDELCLQGGRKAVVFSQWAMMTEMVEQRLRKMGLGCVRLHGGVPTAKRGELMDRFREDDSIQVFISTDAGGVGLNLQSASVLINLDIPWNPAVLEQRIARIHRLGQRERVQVILMVTVEGYEGRVLQLVQNKQNLFDNVIDPDASEDVVGVSPKLLEKLVEDLTQVEKVAGAEIESVEDSGELPEAITTDVSPRQGRENSAIEAEITRCIEALQQALGPRIERIMGANGGLLVIIDRVDDDAEIFSRKLSDTSQIQVALIDLVSLNGLSRLGLFSAQQPVYYDAAEAPQDEVIPALIHFANERLKAAETLLQQEITGPAVDLIVAALLAVAAVRANKVQVISPEQASVWVYSEAIPKGLLDEKQAALIMRGIALQHADSVPVTLLEALIVECREFVSSSI